MRCKKSPQLLGAGRTRACTIMGVTRLLILGPFYYVFFQYNQYAVPQKLSIRTEVLKNAFKKIWTKDSNSTIKEKPNVVIKRLNFEIMAVVG